MKNSILAYSIQKNIVSVYYKDIIDNPLTDGKTVGDIIALVEEKNLPDVVSIKNIKTDVTKVGNKYRLITNLTYISDGESESSSIVFDGEEEYIQDEQKVIILNTRYEVISDESGDIVLDYITE